MHIRIVLLCQSPTVQYIEALLPLSNGVVHWSLDAALWLQVLLNIGKSLHTCTVKRHIIALHPIHISPYVHTVHPIHIYPLTYIQYIPFIYPLTYIRTAHPNHYIYDMWTCDMSRAICAFIPLRLIQYNMQWVKFSSVCYAVNEPANNTCIGSLPTAKHPSNKEP